MHFLSVFALLASASQASAQGGYASTDRFGYSGTVTRYGTQADLLANNNGTSAAFPHRDLGLYFVDNNPGFAGTYPPTAAYFLSAWYLNGGSTPSNQNAGFIQLADDDGGSITSASYSFLDGARTVFNFSATGGNSIYGCSSAVSDCGRLWDGTTQASGGIFHSYSLGFTASGLAAATFNPTTGVYESASDPTSVTGYMNGIFENTSASDPGSNGWYSYSLTIDNTSYAVANGYTDMANSYFAAPEAAVVTPEPASMTLLATGLAGLAFIRRRKNRA